MCKRKTLLITLFLCLAGSMASFAGVITVYEDNYETSAIGDGFPAWNWGDNGTVHNAVYADYEGNIVVQHTGTIDNSAGAAAINARFGSKWDFTLSGNTSPDPNDYIISFDLRSVSGNWDPIKLEFFVLTKIGGTADNGFGSGASEYYQADGWVHVEKKLSELTAGWWAGTSWDMTEPTWSIEIGGPPWPGTSVPAGTPAWDQVWIIDNLKISMLVPVAAVYENDYEGSTIGDGLPAWNWGDNGTVHNAVYADYEGNIVVEHTGTIDNSAGTAAKNVRFGSKWDFAMTGNVSADPNDYTVSFDLRSVSGNWDPIALEFYVLTKIGGTADNGYGSGAADYSQADGWVHVEKKLSELTAGWWAGGNWDMTEPTWSMEVGGPPWPGTSVPAGTPAWDQIWLMDNLKITMVEPTGIIYVDATDGEAGNTTYATDTGQVFAPNDPGTVGSGADGLWRKRGYMNGPTIFEAGGDWNGNNTEDCPRLKTSVAVPEGVYEVYAYMGNAPDIQWRMGASLEDSAAELPVYRCNDPNGEATLAVAEDFVNSPVLTEGDKTLWQIDLGTTGITSTITVYIDDEAGRVDDAGNGNSRTWYDGIGYKPILPVGPVAE